MWQEIVVGLVVFASVIFLVLRVKNKVSAVGDPDSSCGCECSSCTPRRAQERPKCREEARL